jgi:hypothetical protein
MECEPLRGMNMPDQFFKLFLATLTGILAVLFLVVMLVSVARLWRSYRKRTGIGQKAEPTEYIDAWSRYRLKDEDIEDIEVDEEEDDDKWWRK